MIVENLLSNLTIQNRKVELVITAGAGDIDALVGPVREVLDKK